MSLSCRRRMFVEAYLQTWNASEAARRAKYKHPWQLGERLMKVPEIQEAIAARIKEAAIGSDEVLARLSEQARMSIADFVTEQVDTITDKNGDTHELRTVALNWDAIKARGHLIKSIKPTSTGVALELHDAQAALVQLGKHFKLFTEIMEHQIKNPVEVKVYIPDNGRADRDPAPIGASD